MLQQPAALLQLPNLIQLRPGLTRRDAVLGLGLAHPVLNAGLRDSEVLRDLRERRIAPPGDRDYVVSELLGMGPFTTIPAAANTPPMM